MAISDDYFGDPYVDTDEWRDDGDGIRFRYVHGGFDGTDTRFSFYFPPEDVYQNRFISWIEGGQGGSEVNALTGGPIATVSTTFGAEVGAVIVESNQGHIGADLAGCGGDSSILCWRASAESARYMKQLATEMYGAAPRYGYVTGGSGGGVRSINCFERTDVWEGAVPFVMPHPGQGVFFSFLANVIRLLTREERAALAARTGLGGSGDPFESLNGEQREALAALYRAGFPRGAEFVLSNPFEAVLVWSWHSSELMEHDRSYWHDFWAVPGYAGADRPSTFEPFLLEEKSRVAKVVTAGDLLASATEEEWAAGGAAGLIGRAMAMVMPESPFAVVVEGLDRAALDQATGAKVHIGSGIGAGRIVVCLGVVGDALVCSASGEAGNLLFDEVQAGDEVTVSNRDFLAYCHYHRTQTDLDLDQFGEHYPEFEQQVVDGHAVFPTRATFGFETVMVSSRYQYDWAGKMIICQNVHDIGTWPVGAVNYHQRLLKLRGEQATDRDFRVWWFDHAAHTPGSMFPSVGRPHATTRLIEYGGAIQQALRDVIAWVEDDVEPPARSQYEHTVSGAVHLPHQAADRRGIQPVPALTINGTVVASAKTGQPVRLDLRVDVPHGAGSIIAIEWDVTGDGMWEPEPEIDGTKASLTASKQHTYTEPGTYWPSVRVTSHRDGLVDATTRRVPNLAQSRLDVT
ncbi:MAG TPA: PKD domain-containing protein [Acidimicrobiales bacterium]|nr:PKD domain-containing protein [Acidimicrobiales bacterium]